MIADHPHLKERSRFLFIPGPDDAGPSTVLPPCALPKYMTEELQKYIPNNKVLHPRNPVLSPRSSVQNAPFMPGSSISRRN
ncbi:DNA polymerase epsilon subunit B-like isoform X2 [Mangifera indica]|uniref:DNA polymerase epsilon subunit B-like isoform X2 n=1 Tax=Mangifera indica TaxID=29780 RepID=UPI001CF96FCE|nr:DNA polymerase epsilon subunit B-like isoform X2 [Mangifera indica]